MKKSKEFQRKGHLKKILIFLFLCGLLQGGSSELTDDTKETLQIKDQIVDESLKAVILNNKQLYSHQDLDQKPQVNAPPHQTEDVNTSYIIVTTNAIETNSSEMQEFVKYKQYLGFNVEVITEDDYGSVFGQERAHAIRTWLQNQQTPKNIEYVLLIGDPDDGGDVPMLKVWPRSGTGSDEFTFTDYYYADLSGNWDSDSDGLYGEYEDTEVDFQTEVFAGRIPVYDEDYSTLDEILFRIRTHHNQTYEAKNNILLPMAISNYENEDNQGYERTDGLNLPEELYTNVLAGLGMNDTVLYEGAGLDPVLPSAFHYTNNLNASNFETYFNYDQGAVLWWGHGSDSGVYRKYWSADDGDGVPEDNASEMDWEPFVSSSSVGNLETDVPAFIYQSSCNNGNPENSNNLGYALLKQGAAISTVSAAQVSWYGVGEWEADMWDYVSDNTGLGYKYMDNLLRLNLPAGDALFESKYNGGDLWGAESWMNKMEFNLYGDPQLDYWGSLKSTATNPFPAFNSTEISSSTQLMVYVDDPDSDTLTVSFFNAKDDSLIGTQFGVSSGDVAAVEWSELLNDTTYEWYTVTGDGQSYNMSNTWNFTTFQEPGAPTWDPAPLNQFIEFGYEWYYDLNATDPSGIDCYTINDTTHFYIDSETGNLTTVGFLPIGTYPLEIVVNDTLGNENIIEIILQVQETSFPTWNPQPINQFIEFGYEWYYDLNATDPSGIDCYTINDTIHFYINSETGNLTTVGFLPIGTYPLEIMVNDTLGNEMNINLSFSVRDTTSPEWSQAPSDQILTEGNALNIQVIATDLSDITYSINSTSEFVINDEGIIQNITELTKSFYWIKISVVDQYGNGLHTIVKITIEFLNTTTSEDVSESTSEATSETTSEGDSPNNWITYLQPTDTNTQLGIIGGIGGLIVVILIMAKKKS
ncbi:C25 family cysteine peptidase [Candidatus Lokiarchaeum ossiferum]|uniref:C25 family cysteine peptidase n=1 Tax=Candidatus Lokiarchaeum ossiferum TaxID=2951803 RepID=UPI00352DAB32